MGEIVEHYRATRERLTDLGRTLDEAAGATPVPGCPAWTVHDVYAHLAGLCADVLAGQIEGLATDPWTQRQVAARQEHALADIVAEWDDVGPRFEEAMDALGEHADPRAVVDVWTHEQDVRGALGRPGGRDAPAVAFVLGRMLRGYGRAWTKAGRPPVRVVGSSGEWLLGEGEPVATMHADDADLVRTLVGRRSRAQALALWAGAGEPFVDHLVAFSFADHDIVE